MPTSPVSPPRVEPAREPRRKKWTREEVRILEGTGLFQGKRYEPIGGELIDKMGMNEPHALAIMLLNQWLVAVFGGLRVRIQLPIDVAPEDNVVSEPEPGAVVLSRSARDLAGQRPQPSDVALLIEAADSSLAFDLGDKMRLYARAGIADYWVLDIVHRRIIVHRDPREGTYASVIAYSSSEKVAPVCAPDAFVCADEMA